MFSYLILEIRDFESTKDKDIEFRKEGLRKETENETRIREAMHKAEVEARLKAEVEIKAVEERWRMEEEKMNERRDEIEERWLLEEQIRHVQKEHKISMTEEQKCLPEERCEKADKGRFLFLKVNEPKYLMWIQTL
ncbi:hypothetical protein TNIN_409251 [Trichonephila inaurata madagascariensis]|uniref:Uncharacterized protein n=1 Tax=Trichonephila inaurata madagascariensis TaxID=2747483 RepID=A0A8X7BU69_9ARAC|nr:hypothetical protein TNIN_409251 [Trichonephila inaurata madagascariensis]